MEKNDKKKCSCWYQRFCQRCGCYLEEVSAENDPLIHRASMKSKIDGAVLCDDCFLKETEELWDTIED